MAEEQNKPRQLTDAELAVPLSQIPLPPEELRDELDNSSGEGNDSPASEATVVELDYVDEAPGKAVPLQFPFRFGGRVVREVQVSPLSVAEVVSVITKAAPRAPDNMDFYAAMTGLPASVIRALRGDDGEEVTAVAHGFLPRFMRDKGLPSTPGTAESSSSA